MERLGLSELSSWKGVLRDSVQAGCDIVYGEYLLREQLGERPALDDFQRRFPGHADLLARQVQVHHALADPSTPPATIMAQSPAPPTLRPPLSGAPGT